MIIDELRMKPGSDIENIDGTDFIGAAVYDIAGFTLTPPIDGAVILSFIAPRIFNLPTGLVSSVARSDVAPSATTTYSIKKGTSQIATMTFNAGSNIGSFNMGAGVNFSVGDKLSVVAPTPADATHDGLAFTLVALVQ